MKAQYLVPIAAVCAVGLLSGCGGGSDSETIELIEHAETDTVRHIGPANEEDSVGDVLVEGPFYDAKDSTLAITGGTDEYKEASGQMKLHARNPEETEYDFTYEVEK